DVAVGLGTLRHDEDAVVRQPEAGGKAAGVLKARKKLVAGIRFEDHARREAASGEVVQHQPQGVERRRAVIPGRGVGPVARERVWFLFRLLTCRGAGAGPVPCRLPRRVRSRPTAGESALQDQECRRRQTGRGDERPRLHSGNQLGRDQKHRGNRGHDRKKSHSTHLRRSTDASSLPQHADHGIRYVHFQAIEPPQHPLPSRRPSAILHRMTEMPAPPDAYRPAEIARLIEGAGVAKAALPAAQMFVLALLAGAFIGFGAAAYTMVMTGADLAQGPARLLGGLVFSLGLILVIVGGAELFTGNALMVMAAVDGKITARQLLRNWGIVYLGNLAGAAGLAFAFGLSGLLDGPMGATAGKIAATK